MIIKIFAKNFEERGFLKQNLEIKLINFHKNYNLLSLVIIAN